MRILVIEPDAEQRDWVARKLARDGFAVDEAKDLATAEYKWWFTPYHCVVMERRFRETDGLERLEQWRAKGCRTPILVLSTLGKPLERAAGLDAGADGYLVKGVDAPQLAEWVKTVCRRAIERPQTMEEWSRHRAELPHRYAQWGDLELDLGARSVRRNGAQADVTRTEFALLTALLEAAGEPVPHRDLIRAAWDRNADVDAQTLRVHIANLRKKLGQDLILNVRGQGYRLVDPSSGS